MRTFFCSIGNDGNKFYLYTNADAPQYKIITIDLDDYIQASKNGPVHIKTIAKDLIPEDKDAHLEDASIVGKDRLVTVYKRNVCIAGLDSLIAARTSSSLLFQVKDEVYIHSLKTGRRLLRLAEDHVGSIGVSGRRDQNWIFLSLTGFTTPGVVARYDFRDEKETEHGTWKVWRETIVKGLAGSGGFIAEQVSI